MLFGRDAERAEIGALLEGARASQGGALVLRGEPGIGKTALLQDARELAADMVVLSARGVESEAELPFAGLHQFIRPALSVLELLPKPQSAALEGALGLAERRGDDRFLISVACLTVMSELAAQRPVLCLVDDAQWLDVPSADALLFAAHRLTAERIAMLFAARETEARPFDAPGLREVELHELDPESAASVLTSQISDEMAPQVRDVLLHHASGNALALIELPAVLSPAQRIGEQPLPETLPLTRGLERLFLERVRKLPGPTQQLLLIGAADDSGRLATIMRAADVLGIGAEALGAAERAQIVSVRGPTLEMRHPLVRSAVYGAAPSLERRAVHLALAEALDGELDSDQRAWHRAAAASAPDADIADELEEAAQRARLRSGHAAAERGLSRAAELSVDAQSQARRLVAAAEAAWHGGHPAQALVLLDRANPIVSDPRLRAEEDHLRGIIGFWCGNLLDASAALMVAADSAAAVDARRAVRMLFDAGEAAGWAGDFARMIEVGKRAGALPRTDDEDDAFLADLLAGVGGLFEGRTAREVPLVLDVIARAEHVQEPRWLVWAASAAGVAGDKEREASLLRRAVAQARASGAVDALTHALATVALRGLLDGRFGVAVEAAEGVSLAREARLPNAVSIHLAVLAWLEAIRGHDGECRSMAAEVSEAARATAHGFAISIADWAIGLLDLGRGRPDDAVTRLTAMTDARPGEGQPFVALVSVPDLVEACVRTGRDEQAKAAYAMLERFADPGAPTWSLALASRCRALLLEGDAAEREFVSAMSLHSESRRWFDRARTALLYGEFLRRQRRRTESRDQLRAAADGFERLGAEPWSDRARRELRASGEALRKRDPSAIDQLTPRELQIARLVAQGLPNKEIAVQLFLSPRTVDYHLRSVFVKLAITSRMQLARWPLGDEEPVVGQT